jgi:polyisoprenyl-phosphate glycosyltransferase
MNNISKAKHTSETKSLISVIIPVYNEAQILKQLAQCVIDVIKDCGDQHEIIFVNDGSQDNSAEILDKIASTDPYVKVLHFSRNFGHQPAVQAGLTYAKGEAVIIMDADLQDNPEKISAFLRKWREGYDVVFAIRTARKENIIKRFFFNTFYRILNRISHTSIPVDAGNFSLVSRKVADQIVRLQDYDRYLPGLRNWVGFKQVGIEVERENRYDAHPRVSLHGLFLLAKTAIFSFSSLPLSIFYGIAFISLTIFVILCFFTFYHKFFTGLAIPGWTSFLMVTSFFGSINALGIGILGEYVLRIYNQVRARPLFIIKREVNFSEDNSLFEHLQSTPTHGTYPDDKYCNK